MNRDEARAGRRLAASAMEFAQIQSLPKDVGTKVRWPHNGVVWTRTDEDEWQTESGPGQGFAPSAHVAGTPFEVLVSEPTVSGREDER